MIVLLKFPLASLVKAVPIGALFACACKVDDGLVSPVIVTVGTLIVGLFVGDVIFIVLFSAAFTAFKALILPLPT